MLIADYDYDTDIRIKKQEAYEEGISQGIAQQKAEDEKLLSEERNKNKQQAKRIRELEALLASRKTEEK